MAFATARRLRVAGVNVLGSPLLNSHRERIIEFAAKARLPAITIPRSLRLRADEVIQ